MKHSVKSAAVISLLLVMLMILTTACSGTSSTQTGQTGQTGQTASSGTASGQQGEAPQSQQREDVTIKLWYPMHASASTDDFVGQLGDIELAERTGVTIDWVLAPDSNKDELYNLMMASNDLPDVVVNNVKSIKKYREAFLPLNDYIQGSDRYPNLDQYIYGDDYVVSYLSDNDGQNRIIPMLAVRRVGDMLQGRGDLLEKYGYKMEDLTTIDVWYDLFATIKQNEPGVVPYVTRMGRGGLFRLVEGAYDCLKEDYFVEDGVMKYGVLDPRGKEAIEFMRKCYAEGLIDQEYLTTDWNGLLERIYNGDVFLTHDNIVLIPLAQEQFDVQGKDWTFIAFKPMTSAETGLANTTIHYPRVRHCNAAITVTAKNVERILDMYEYLFSDEGYLLHNFGIEGVSYEMVDGMPVTIPEYAEKVEAGEIAGMGVTRDNPGNQADELVYNYNDMTKSGYPAVIQGRDMYLENEYIRQNWLEPLLFTDEETDVIAQLETEITTYRGEMLDKFILGMEPMENWDAFVQELKNMGVEDLIQIYQDSLDRINAN